MIYPAYTAELLDALRGVGAEEQIEALVARSPAAHVDMSEPLFDVLDLITALHKVGAGEQAAVLAKRATAAADPDDLVSTSALLTALHDAGGDQLVPDRLINGLAARADVTDAHEVAMLLESLATIGADAEVSALLARDPAANADLTSASNVAYLLNMLKEIGANTQAAALLARDPLAHVGQGEAAAALLELLPVLQGQAVDTTIAALIERLPAEGAFTAFLRHSERAEDYRFGRRHDGRLSPGTGTTWSKQSFGKRAGRPGSGSRTAPSAPGSAHRLPGRLAAALVVSVVECGAGAVEGAGYEVAVDLVGAVADWPRQGPLGLAVETEDVHLRNVVTAHQRTPVDLFARGVEHARDVPEPAKPIRHDASPHPEADRFRG